eukprot:600785-Prorocentrum_minimum.AAC.1
MLCCLTKELSSFPYFDDKGPFGIDRADVAYTALAPPLPPAPGYATESAPFERATDVAEQLPPCGVLVTDAHGATLSVRCSRCNAVRPMLTV